MSIAIPGQQPQMIVAYPINEVCEMAIKQIASDVFLALWEKEGLAEVVAPRLSRTAAEIAFALNDVCNDILSERAEMMQREAKAVALARK